MIKREWLQKARRKAGISATEMGAACGYSMSGWYYIESGKRKKRLDMDTASQIAQKLGMTLDEVFAEEKKREQQREPRVR